MVIQSCKDSKITDFDDIYSNGMESIFKDNSRIPPDFPVLILSSRSAMSHTLFPSTISDSSKIFALTKKRDS